jgi:hypothetical protein
MNSHAISESRWPTDGNAELTAAFYVLLLLPLPLVCFALHELMWVSGGVVMLVLAIAAAAAAAKRRFYRRTTPVVLFFVVATGHAVIGYALAAPTSIAMPVASNASYYNAGAFILVSGGLLAAAVGYGLVLRSRMTGPAWCTSFEVDEVRLVRWARFLMLAGAVLMSLVYARLGFVPLLTYSPGENRFITEAMSSTYLRDEWLASRAMDLLTYTLPLVLLSATWKKRRLDWLLVLIGFLALLLPLRRSPMISIIVVVTIALCFKLGKVPAKAVATVVLLLALYVGSQLAFSKITDFDNFAFAIAGSTFPEVRDFGWTMSLMGPERWSGMTFVQALSPIPSFLSDFSQQYGMRGLGSQLVGSDSGRVPPRVSLAGEAYLNFGYSGPALLGFIFGMIGGYLDLALRLLNGRRLLWAYFIAAQLFTWICFWVYLAGTEGAATIKIGCLLLLAMYYLSRKTAVMSVA